MNTQITTRLHQAEEVIDQGIAGYKAAGDALREIRDEELYKSAAGTFEEYCKSRWGWERAHAYRLIDAAEVAKVCLPLGDIKNERQARELTKLPNAELQKAAFGVAETIAAQSSAGKVTAKTVAKAVDLVQKVVAENPNIKAEDIAKKAIEYGAIDDIEPKQAEQATPAEEESEGGDEDNLTMLINSVDALSEENNHLKSRISDHAAVLFASGDDERAGYFARLSALTAENKQLKEMNIVLTEARDRVMRENVSLRKQGEYAAKKLKAFEKVAA